MNQKDFVTIFPTIGSLDVVEKTLPSVLEESSKNNACVIVRENSFKYTDKIEWLLELDKKYECMWLMVTGLVSVSTTLNTCLYLAKEMYNPKYISFIEDDHGYNKGFIPEMMHMIDSYYGKKSPTGLSYGMFSGCNKHIDKIDLDKIDGNLYPTLKNDPNVLGGHCACCICTYTSHWDSVLKGYDSDEYLLSSFQTKSLRNRNYNKGYTYMISGKSIMNYIDRIGRGGTTDKKLRRWDPKYSKSDKRSKCEKDE
jgi:hypothetical protein